MPWSSAATTSAPAIATRSGSSRLGDLDAEPVKGEILDLKAMRKAMRGCDTVFHVAGFVASKPVEKVWELNQRGPIVAVEAAAMEDVKRVVLTSTISAVGTANGRPADEDNPYPEDGLGLVYADAKRGGEREAIAAGERLGVEVVVVNPAYVLGVPVDTSQPGETSTRIVGNYLRGRLPAVLDAADQLRRRRGRRRRPPARRRQGQPRRALHPRRPQPRLGRADRHGRPRLRRQPPAARASPPRSATIARLRERVGLPGAISAEAFGLMGQDWRFTSAKAKRELGYKPRPLAQTVSATVEWYLELIEDGAFDDSERSPLSVDGRRPGAGRPLRALVAAAPG